ncbi:MAG: hypothetical protein A4E36_02116 [Methanoregulaceae archaeon PtaB.Bin009]|nr:MAG: hypothetical protein A4E36_02116 [Methanoregulaceae archaeon PtaB.Bin009]
MPGYSPVYSSFNGRFVTGIVIARGPSRRDSKKLWKWRIFWILCDGAAGNENEWSAGHSRFRTGRDESDIYI